MTSFLLSFYQASTPSYHYSEKSKQEKQNIRSFVIGKSYKTKNKWDIFYAMQCPTQDTEMIKKWLLFAQDTIILFAQDTKTYGYVC